MIFQEGNSRFELRLDGYQFQEIDNRDDANWLKVTITVDLPQGSYAATSPCLRTDEVRWLALWLENLVRDIPQMREIGGREPNLEFEHLRTDGEEVTMRVHIHQEMRPPWSRGEDTFSMDFKVPKSQVEHAAIQLQAQLESFPPRASLGLSPPFVAPRLSPWFFIDWLLVVPGASDDEAVWNAFAYLREFELEPVLRDTAPVRESDDTWYVGTVTDLPIPGDKPLLALFHVLTHLPSDNASVGSPVLWPNGVLTCAGKLLPKGEADDGTLSDVRGWFEVTNRDGEHAYSRLIRQRQGSL